MKSEKRSGKAGAESPGRSRGMSNMVLVLVSLAAAAGAYWVTQRFLGNPPPVQVSSTVVSVPAVNPGSITATGTSLTASDPGMTGAVRLAQAPQVDPGTPPPIDTNDPVQLLNRGNEYLNRGLIDPAIDHYRMVLGLNPEDEEAHFNLGFAYARKGEVEKAIAAYRRSLELFPDYGEAHNNLGNIFVKMKQYELAMTHLSAAIRINPDNSSALNNLGRCLAEQGRTQDALTQFQEAARLNTNSVEAYFNIGNSYLILGRPESAIPYLEKVLVLAPGFQPASAALQRAKAAAASQPR